MSLTVLTAGDKDALRQSVLEFAVKTMKVAEVQRIEAFIYQFVVFVESPKDEGYDLLDAHYSKVDAAIDSLAESGEFRIISGSHYQDACDYMGVCESMYMPR